MHGVTMEIHKIGVTHHSYMFRLMLGISLSSSLYVLNTKRMPYLKIASDKYSNHLLRKPNSLLEEYWA